MYHRLEVSDGEVNDEVEPIILLLVHKGKVCCTTRKRRCCCSVCGVFTVSVLSLALFIIIAVFKKRPEIISQQTLWSSGDNGVHTYRIPLVIGTPNGTLIVVAEARKKSSKDDGQKHLSIRRSIDQGRTWKNEANLLSGEKYKDIQIDLGALLVNSASIGLFYSIYEDEPHYSLMYASSYDDGQTWQEDVNISQQIGLLEFSIGPGYGIEKKYPPFVGRMIVCGHGTKQYGGTCCILSDDNGKTWRKGANIKSIPYGDDGYKYQDFYPDEAQVVELPNGSIFLIIRNEKHYHCYCRITVLSFDGGESFSSDSLRLVDSLPDSGISAGLLFHNGKLLYSSPSGRILRRTLTLMMSEDNGVTWPKSTVLWPLASAYSSLTSFPNSTSDYLYVVFEKGNFRNYLSIEFMIIDLSLLK